MGNNFESKNMKLVRTSTVPGSLETFCKGLLQELQEEEYEVVAVSAPGDALSEIREREGVRTVEVPMERRISPLKDLRSLWRMIRVFRKEKPDMVHSITPKAGLLSMIAAKICGIPVRVHTFTGLVFPTATGLKQKVLILTDRLTCACASHIIPEGEGVKKDLVDYKITKKPLKVLGYGNIRGIDLEYYKPDISEVRQEASKISKPDVFTFIFIGRLVRDKGINELVKAFVRLNRENPKTRLILVGSEEQNIDPLDTMTIDAIKENDSIEAVGRQSDVRPWLAASDALVFPSYREGFPNVVIEAGAMGLPSIVTDINGSREIIIGGKNGIIIPSKDEDALYNAMKRFVDNPEDVANLAKEARPLIASRFEQGFVRQCLKDYYKEITTNIQR